MTTPTTPPPEPTAEEYAALADQLEAEEGGVHTVDTPSDQGADGQTPDGEPEGGGGNREAAGYRRRLRAAEGERDTLAGRIERYQRAEVERLAADRLAVPADVFGFGAELGDLLTPEGDVDGAAVAAAVDRLITDRPGLRKATVRTQVGLGGGNRQAPPTGPSWSDVLKRQ